MKCEHNVLRNGYWTGKRCSREGRFSVRADMIKGHPDLTVMAWNRINRGPREIVHVSLCRTHAEKVCPGVAHMERNW